MANKIQLRRDTTANWNNVNPILADGEPGLDITTNQVKYGDGANAWVDLSYASGGSGSGNTLVNGSYVVSLDSSGHLILPEDNGNQTFIIGNNVVLQSGFGTHQWSFDNTGRLTLPNGWEITNQNGSAIFADVALTGSYNNLSDKPTSLTNNGHTLSLETNGNLTVPGEIHSNSGVGSVTIQSNDGSNPRNFTFNTDGSISLPHLLTGSQGVGSIDAQNNALALTSADTVDFANFSGMILVNSHNNGGVTLYLCGGGSGDAVAIGDSKVGNSVGSLAVNSGISGYTFTANESGYHVFFAIRTRDGA